MSEAAAHDNSDKPDDKPEVGTSLAPAVEAPGGIDPFLAEAAGEAPEAAAARPFYAKALDYSAHAAMIVGLVGFAWTVSDHVVRHQPADPKPAKLANASTATPGSAKSSTTVAATATQAEATKPDEIGDLRKSNQKMTAEIRSLHASLEALRTTVVRERSSGDDARALSASLDATRASLASLKSEQAAALAQLSGKVEKLQREARAQAVADRVPARTERQTERQAIDTTTTASIPAAAAPRSAAPSQPVRTVPTPPAKPTVLASNEPPARGDMGRPEADAGKPDDSKPPVIQGWVVRDVYEGVALIEGRRGQMEVVPGVSIPGAGVVKSIERHGSGWTVTTTKGQVAYAAPMRDYRRGPGPMRDYYGPPRRYDF